MKWKTLFWVGLAVVVFVLWLVLVAPYTVPPFFHG